jgi:hypothetical protein
VDPDVLEDAENGDLPRLVHEGVVGDDGEVDVHGVELSGFRVQLSAIGCQLSVVSETLG